MRLYELISEAISVTTLKNPIKEEMQKQILDSTHQIYNKESQLDPDIKEEANRRGSLNKVAPIVKNWLKKELTNRISEGIEDVVKKHKNIESGVLFRRMRPGIGASSEYLDMIFNNDNIDNIADSVFKSMFKVTLKTFVDDKIVEALFLSFKNATLEELFGEDSNLNAILDQLISDIVHEFTHVSQHAPQLKKGMTDVDYRSYLEKDKNKFKDIMKQASDSEEMTPLQKRLYYSSPQEIGAYSQQSALQFINDMDVDNLKTAEDFRKFKQNIPNTLKDYINQNFNDKTNYKEYAVFKRFNKLMYQEVMRYVNQAEKQLLKNKAPVR